MSMVTIILTQYLFYRNGHTLSNSNSSYMSNNESACGCNNSTVVQKDLFSPFLLSTYAGHVGLGSGQASHHYFVCIQCHFCLTAVSNIMIILKVVQSIKHCAFFHAMNIFARTFCKFENISHGLDIIFSPTTRRRVMHKLLESEHSALQQCGDTNHPNMNVKMNARGAAYSSILAWRMRNNRRSLYDLLQHGQAILEETQRKGSYCPTFCLVDGDIFVL